MSRIHLLPPASMARSTVWRNHSRRGSIVGEDGSILSTDAQIVLSHRGYLLVSRGGLHRVEQPFLADNGITGTAIYLGDDAGCDVVGLELSDDSRSVLDALLDQGTAVDADVFLSGPARGIAVSEPTWFDLRMVAMDLSDTDAGLATSLIALSNWHVAHTHSPRNGHPTEPVLGGWVRKDPSTGSEHFPRTDPAVIMAVTRVGDDGTEYILLGNNALWPAGRYSLLAGFVEPGETLEAAVIREVREEASIECRSPRYVGSQPWPFPCSLMLGFFAEASSTEIAADDDEMDHVHWFSRSELREKIDRSEVSVPGEVSIAGQMLTMWLDGE